MKFEKLKLGFNQLKIKIQLFMFQNMQCKICNRTLVHLVYILIKLKEKDCQKTEVKMNE